MLSLTPASRLYRRADLSRRWLGLGMDWLGLGPIESPSRIVSTQRGFTLRAYQELGESGPTLLIVPAPIKRPYIWDLAPHISAVHRCRQGGICVYMMDWQRPGPADQDWSLADYADQFILQALELIESEGRPQPFLAGHSLGGTQAAIFASLYPHRARGLILIEAPICFGPQVGALDALVARSPPAGLLTSILGNPPGTFLNITSSASDPADFLLSRWEDGLRSVGDWRALRMHCRVERWTLDESPLARRFYEQVTDLLYRENRFMTGSLTVAEKPAKAEQVDIPILSVVDPTSRLVPPAAVLPFHDAARSDDTQVLWREQETGVALQHVGSLVGQRAHQHLWPQILLWIHARQDRPVP